mmetsp:Transcript_29157/g.69496  ORF Transcript_29157/g.69496 Transcript_29157/m.69496 type:complete len:267 (+) Transcript_29157:1231-2031(+)
MVYQPSCVALPEPLAVLLLPQRRVLPLQSQRNRSAEDPEVAVIHGLPKHRRRKPPDQPIQEVVQEEHLTHKDEERRVIQGVHILPQKDGDGQKRHQHAPGVVGLNEVKLWGEGQVVHALQGLCDGLIQAGVIKEPTCHSVAPAPFGVEHVIVDAHVVLKLRRMVHEDVHHDLEGSNDDAEEQVAHQVRTSDVVLHRDLSFRGEEIDSADNERRHDRTHAGGAAADDFFHGLFDGGAFHAHLFWRHVIFVLALIHQQRLGRPTSSHQ